MLQQTFLRLEGIGVDTLPTQVICNEAHRFLVAEQAREIKQELQSIVLEPVGRNTAPALTISALWQLQLDVDAVILMMPADHLVKNVSAFQSAIRSGFEKALTGKIVTFGIEPVSPETGYGYIEYDELSGGAIGGEVFDIKSFKEKPELTFAEKYLASGNYLWNSGLFMMKASKWIDIINSTNTLMLECCKQALSGGKQDNDFFWLNSESFNKCPDDSIDYAVMENVDKDTSIQASVVKLDAGWSDIGSWSSLWEESDKDEDGNVIQGDILHQDTTNSLIRSDSRLVAVIGCDDIVVVDTADAVMIADKSRSQEVKTVVDKLKLAARKEYENHLQVFRPWGSYETLEIRDGFQVKRIIVMPGKRLSLQLHHQRSEHWVIVKGIGTVTLNDREFELKENESTFVPLETRHRLENRTSEPLVIIEVQVGSYLGEDDIVRFDDDFGRA